MVTTSVKSSVPFLIFVSALIAFGMLLGCVVAESRQYLRVRRSKASSSTATTPLRQSDEGAAEVPTPGEGDAGDDDEPPVPPDQVWVSAGGGGRRFHYDRDCHGLRNAAGKVKLTPCRICVLHEAYQNVSSTASTTETTTRTTAPTTNPASASAEQSTVYTPAE